MPWYSEEPKLRLTQQQRRVVGDNDNKTEGWRWSLTRTSWRTLISQGAPNPWDLGDFQELLCLSHQQWNGWMDSKVCPICVVLKHKGNWYHWKLTFGNNPCHFSSLLQPFPNPSTHRAFLSAGSAAADCNGTHAGQHQQLSYHTSDQLSRCQQFKTQSNVSL